MTTLLEDILSSTRRRLARSKEAFPPRELRAAALRVPPAPRLAPALRAPCGDMPRVLAELKRASPSRGLLREDFDPASLALALEKAGAAALSVLTEPEFFRGSGDALRAAARAASLPVLRKDFIVDAYQLYEARLWGAGAVLLIAAALDGRRLRDLLRDAEDLGLDVLAEAHDRRELDELLDAGAAIIGVNSRNLRTLEIDMEQAACLLVEIPGDRLRIAESGVRDAADLRALRAAGADAFLIGSSLMAAASPARALARLLAPFAAQNTAQEGVPS